jgi:hypothetical protein
MKRTIVLFFIFLTVSSDALFAQNALAGEDLERFKKRAVEYIDNFQNLIKDMVATKDPEDKKEDITAILFYFIENSKMEVANLSGNNRKVLLKDYLTNSVAKYNERFAMVVLEFDVAQNELEEFIEKRDSNGEIYYEAAFTFVQIFKAIKNPVVNDVEHPLKYDVSDKTKKRGVIIVKKGMTITGEKWILKLGDISVEEIIPN